VEYIDSFSEAERKFVEGPEKADVGRDSTLDKNVVHGERDDVHGA
jgi:hypothetical protein